MIGIADDGLIEIPNLHVHFSIRGSQGPQITGMAVSTDPYRRPFGHRALTAPLEPLIELHRTSAHVCMRGTGHFERSSRFEGLRAFRRRDRAGFLVGHGGTPVKRLRTAKATRQ